MRYHLRYQHGQWRININLSGAVLTELLLVVIWQKKQKLFGWRHLQCDVIKALSFFLWTKFLATRRCHSAFTPHSRISIEKLIQGIWMKWTHFKFASNWNWKKFFSSKREKGMKLFKSRKKSFKCRFECRWIWWRCFYLVLKMSIKRLFCKWWS